MKFICLENNTAKKCHNPLSVLALTALIYLVPMLFIINNAFGNDDPPTQAPNHKVPLMNIEQTLSDQAQLMTIAFDGLAFVSGDMCADTFLPPGKVADFSGFQYLRDNDPTGMGHNTDFVTIIAFNILAILSNEQIDLLVDLAKSQIAMINQYGYQRFPLINAFRRLLTGDLPTGSTGLSKSSVMAYSAELYRLDGQISYERAETLGYILRHLADEQQSALDALTALNGVGHWDSQLDDPLRQLYPELSRDEHVAVMTYASEMYSWYAGSVEADTYFCPERQGTYFGSFYMKDMPAMGNAGFSIPDNLTAEMGDSFLNALNDTQAQLITDLVNIQRDALNGIVDTRSKISSMLRMFMLHDSVDKDAVLSLAEQYGRLDGEIIYQYATHFSTTAQSLDSVQLDQITAIREQWNNIPCSGAYLYSVNIPMPDIINTDFLFNAQEQPYQDNTYNSLVDENAELKLIADGFIFAEGPAADSSGNVYFSDIFANRVYQWSPTHGLKVFKEDSGGTNGLFINNNAGLLAAEGSNKRIVSLDPFAQTIVLAHQYNGQSFNEPNDLWATNDGGIYFTDPVYNGTLSQDGEHVYYLSPLENKLIRVVDDMIRPNGIIGTANGQTLYITDQGANETYRYTINDDASLSDKTLFASVGGDGMTLDSLGNLYIAEETILIYNTEGTLIENIAMPQQPTNLTFGGSDGKTLFITTKTALYSLRMNVSGTVYAGPDLFSPQVDIKVNGFDGQVNIDSTSDITISINLLSGNYRGQVVDCWIWAETPFGLYSYVFPSGWQYGLNRVMQFPLTDIVSPFEVLTNSTLPQGEYLVHFAIDNNVDGNLDATRKDTIHFNVD